MKNPARRPETWLAVVVVAVLLIAADCLRPPPAQLTARLYIDAVYAYQRWGRPITTRFIRCPYRPTCSEYSRQAVEKFGVPRGLVLTTERLWRCRGSVPQGTRDPVP